MERRQRIFVVCLVSQADINWNTYIKQQVKFNNEIDYLGSMFKKLLSK